MNGGGGAILSLVALLATLVIAYYSDVWFGKEVRRWLGKEAVSIVMVSLIMFGVVLLIKRFDIDMDVSKTNGQPVRVVTVEGLDNLSTDANMDMDMNINESESFCDKYKSQPSELDAKCAGLTEKSCDATSCCVFINGERCVAGNKNGPMFRTSAETNENIDIKHYKHKGVCYGNCPSE